MAKAPSKKSDTNMTPLLRKTAVVLIATAGLIFFIGYMFSHWAHRQLLTTDNWVQMVAPLPKNEEVSASLADYTIDRLFTGIDVEQRVSEVLPPEAAFIAPALTERIDARATLLAQDFIQSDRFQGLWMAANRQAHQRLVDKARADSPPPENEKKPELPIQLQGLITTVKERLGVNSQSLLQKQGSAGREGSDVGLKVKLEVGFENFKKTIQAIDFLNSVLLLAAIACFLGALVMSKAKRRLIIILLAIISVTSLLQLIGVRALRPEIINQVEQASYQPAAGVIYDELVSSFKRGATVVFALSTIAMASIAFIGSAWFSRQEFVKRMSRAAAQTSVWDRVCKSRGVAYSYRLPIVGTAVFLILAFMAFVPDFDWTGLIQAGLAALIASFAILLFSKKPGKHNTAATRRRKK